MPHGTYQPQPGMRVSAKIIPSEARDRLPVPPSGGPSEARPASEASLFCHFLKCAFAATCKVPSRSAVYCGMSERMNNNFICRRHHHRDQMEK